jgi:hypothetical protein
VGVRYRLPMGSTPVGSEELVDLTGPSMCGARFRLWRAYRRKVNSVIRCDGERRRQATSLGRLVGSNLLIHVF